VQKASNGASPVRLVFLYVATLSPSAVNIRDALVASAKPRLFGPQFVFDSSADGAMVFKKFKYLEQGSKTGFV